MTRPIDIALYLAKSDPYSVWIREALEHLGLPFTELTDQTFGRLPEFQLLILGGAGEMGELRRRTILDWVESQHAQVVAIGSEWGVGGLFGLARGEGILPRTTLTMRPEDRLWPKGALPSLVVGAPVVTLHGGAMAGASAQGHPLVVRGKGGIFIGPHLGYLYGTVALGRAVESDALGPADDTAWLLDGVPKAEDGIALSWSGDRESPEGTPHGFFLRPHVDTLREVFYRAIIEASEATGRSVALPWFWPDNLEGAACVSYEIDDLSAENMILSLSSLQRYGMPATWLVPMPGLPQDAYRAMRRLGHDIGLLFKGERDTFTMEQMKIQQLQLARASGAQVSVVRAMGGRWERLTEFYRFLNELGMSASVSKGGRQSGTSGFGFGTSHPFRPVMTNGDLSTSFEVPFQLFRPGVGSHERLLGPIFEQVAAHNGVIHMASDTSTVSTNQRERVTQEFLMRVRQARFAQMTVSGLIDFELGRRNLRIRASAGQINLIPDRDLSGLSFLMSDLGLSGEAKGSTVRSTVVERFGRKWSHFQLDLERKEGLDLSLKQSHEAA